MARYIDADKLAEYITTTYCKNCDIYDGEKCNACPMNDALNYIETFQTADVVPRAECEKWYHEYHGIKDALKQEKEYSRSTEKLADKYFIELQTAKEEISRLEMLCEQLGRDVDVRLKYIYELEEKINQIFKEIGKFVCTNAEDYNKFAELKKKYTEEKQ